MRLFYRIRRDVCAASATEPTSVSDCQQNQVHQQKTSRPATPSTVAQEFAAAFETPTKKAIIVVQRYTPTAVALDNECRAKTNVNKENECSSRHFLHPFI